MIALYVEVVAASTSDSVEKKSKLGYGLPRHARSPLHACVHFTFNVCSGMAGLAGNVGMSAPGSCCWHSRHVFHKSVQK